MYMFCPMCKNVGTVSHRRNMRSPTGSFAFLPLAFLPLLSSPFASFSRGLFTLGFLPPLCFDRPCLDSSGSARDHGGDLMPAGAAGASAVGAVDLWQPGRPCLLSISGGILRHGTDGNSRERATTNERGVAQVQHSRGLVACCLAQIACGRVSVL